MARNGSGTYVAPSSSWNPAINNTLATSGDWQALLNDIVAALTQSLSRDGQGPMTGNLQMGGNKITGLTAGDGTGQALIYEQLFNQGTEADLASAATTDIGAQLTNFLRITGTTTITSFGTNYKGPRFLRFAGAVLLTNSATLSLPGGANITTAAGDCLIVIPTATLGTADGWRVVAYQKNAVPGTVADGSISTAKLSTDLQNATYGFKNRIINGAMMIDQRNAGAAIAGGVGGYPVDRFSAFVTGVTSAIITVQQISDAPAGFINSLKYTVTTAGTSYGAGGRSGIYQRIEGYNVADFGFGTAGAATITLSFWVKSSVAGAFSGSLTNNAGDRSYPFSFTINNTGIWEQKTITVAGDQSGTWLKDNGRGLVIEWCLGAEAAKLGTAGAWAGAWYTGVTGTTALINTLNATFQLAGVQLEKGSTATAFDYRPYGTELALCQRYYYKGQVSTATTNDGYTTAAGSIYMAIPLPVTMRANPSLVDFAYANFTILNVSSQLLQVIGPSQVNWRIQATATGRMYSYPNTTQYFEASAEL